jgi:hypothetical protein
VQLAGGQGEHNLECGCGERIEFSFWHSSSMIDISMNDYKSDQFCVSTDLTMHHSHGRSSRLMKARKFSFQKEVTDYKLIMSGTNISATLQFTEIATSGNWDE